MQGLGGECSEDGEGSINGWLGIKSSFRVVACIM